MKPTIFPCKEPWSGLIKTESEMAGGSQHKRMYHKLAPPPFEFELSVDPSGRLNVMRSSSTAARLLSKERKLNNVILRPSQRDRII
jgi:hypothetical protein